MDNEKMKAEIARQQAMLAWLAKRYAKDVSGRRCPAKLSVCNQRKVRTTCSALIIEAAELAVSKEPKEGA